MEGRTTDSTTAPSTIASTTDSKQHNPQEIFFAHAANAVRALTLVFGNNQRLMAQPLLSVLVLSQPLYSVYLTLSHATLNAFALVLVVIIVVAQLFAPQAGKKKRHQSTPEVFLTAKTRASRRTNAALTTPRSPKELVSELFQPSAMSLAVFKRRHELCARRLIPQLFVNSIGS